MWNRRKDENLTPQTAAKPASKPASSEPAKEAIPMSTYPTRPETHADSANSAVIGKSVIIKGQIISREDLTIDGEVEGTVELQEHRLTVGPNAKVSAGIKAREVVVLGTIQGNVETSDRIDIRKDARLIGDLKTARIMIEDGAYFKGTIDIIRSEPARSAAPAPKPQAVSSPSSATVVAAGVGDTKR